MISYVACVPPQLCKMLTGWIERGILLFNFYTQAALLQVYMHANDKHMAEFLSLPNAMNDIVLLFLWGEYMLLVFWCVAVLPDLCNQSWM